MVFQVPADFDADACLPGADASSKERIIATFPLVFLLRWLTLRSEVGTAFDGFILDFQSVAHSMFFSLRVLHLNECRSPRKSRNSMRRASI